MLKKKISYLIMILIVTSMLYGCQQSESKTISYQINPTTSQPSDEPSSGSETINGITYNTLYSPKGKLSIVRKPSAPDFSYFHSDPITDLSILEKAPVTNEVDLRSADLRKLDLTSQFDTLKYATFDSKTQWPELLPKEFDIDKIIEYGKDPGLHIKELHDKGITGKGVGIAIIDQALLVDHVEYKDQLKLYEEIFCQDEDATMHGAAVSSIAVGKNVGVAPDANLYYIANTCGTYKKNKEFEFDYNQTAKCIDRIIEINTLLPENEKIRAISISLGFISTEKGYQEYVAAVNRALDANILTISVTSDFFNGDDFLGAGRDLLHDSNDENSYGPALFYGNINEFGSNLYVPIDSRCVASPTGINDYTFYADGGMSWGVPYVAGLYALACQVYPDITPAEFWKELHATRTLLHMDTNIGKKPFKLINPVGFIEKLESISK